MSNEFSGYNPPESNSNMGRNTGDPSGMQPPIRDSGALAPSSGEDPSAKGRWISLWVVIALLVLAGIVWWLIATGDSTPPAGVPTSTSSASTALSLAPSFFR